MYKLITLLSSLVICNCSTPCAFHNQAQGESYMSDLGEVYTPSFFKCMRKCNQRQVETPESLREKQMREAMMPSYVVADGQRYRLQTPYLEQDKFQTWRPKKRLTRVLTNEPEINHGHNHNNSTPPSIDEAIDLNVE